MSDITESVADAISLSDAIVLDRSFAVSDTLSISDGALLAYKFLLSDAILFSDEIDVSIFHPAIKLIDTINLADSVDYLLSYGMAVGDTLAFSDGIVFPEFRVPADTLAFTDAVTATVVNLIINTGIGVGDALQFIDSIQDETVGRISVSDQLSLLDGVLVVFESDLNSYLRGYLNDRTAN